MNILDNSSVFVAGHKGMVGTAIIAELKRMPGVSIITADREQLDLTQQAEVEKFIASKKPDVIIIAAAKVGGIQANNTYPAQFIYENLMIEANLIHAAFQNGVERLLLLGSSCIYPKFAEQPMPESALLTGILEPTNEPYAIAKIAGIKLCESYNRQYGTDYRTVMPTNLYGPNDNFHPENSHVIPALIRRIHEANEKKLEEVTIWGTGKARREFLYVEDMAKGALAVLSAEKEKLAQITTPMLSHINIGTGVDISIGDLAELIKKTIGYSGELVFDTTKPDGTPRKLLDVQKIKTLGWQPAWSLEKGLKNTCQWFKDNSADIRH